MKPFNLQEFISHLHQTYKEFILEDVIGIYFQESTLPIKINHSRASELKSFHASCCVYDFYNEDFTINDYTIEAEILVFQEYFDSPFSIYIDKNGVVQSYEYNTIHTIEVENIFTLYISNNIVTHYSFHKDIR